MNEPAEAVALFGEIRGATERREISAGSLHFTLEGLALRWIRFAGVEVLRGIAFVVRDRNWGTFEPSVTVENETTNGDDVQILLGARIIEGEASLECRMEVQALGGKLSVSAQATSQGRFVTNRTGFVVLHGSACAGGPIRVSHTAGGTSAGTFPLLVSPHQPFFDIAQIEHEPAPGLAAEVRFSGEVFEMEDQRNWSDASFKTYSRPLTLPYPYTIENGQTVEQTVAVTVRGRPARHSRAEGDVPRIEVTEQPAGRLPELGLGGRARDYRGTDPLRRRLADMQPSLLMLEAEPDAPLNDFRASLAASAAQSAIMLRVDVAGLAAWRARLAKENIRPAAIALATHEQALVDEARQLFPNTRIGAGTDAFFAEFNRKPPPNADFRFWTVNPTVHAMDDASVMETLSALADQAASARARFPSASFWLSAITLRMRFNPNATGPDEPDPPGSAPANSDPRQRGLIAAAFTLGQIAAWAAAGIETLLFYAPFGARGVIHAPGGFPAPWYDERQEGTVYPAYLVLAGLGEKARPREIRAVNNEIPEHLVALATADALWLANRGAADIEISTPGTTVRVLDSTSFAEAALRPQGFWTRSTVPLKGRLKLGSYAVARVQL